ncbi:MAG TPA: GIY-YIG nuclease family protein [Candidatus Methylomirabilis sp.]|nr:GIY-YIG nuclease family protein [Candidatus Methylomirabilis sp.]HSC69754.1 GIY-YIG nuclease family protein [Candidatus Methylomirabilis sp.]
MSWNGTEKFPLGTFTVLEKAPPESGVYALYAGRKWVYVGQSENIQLRLLRHLNGPDACIITHDVTSFAYELTPAEARLTRQDELIAEYRPACRGNDLISREPADRSR